VTKPSYVAAVLVLYRTLRAVSSYPLVVIATDTLPELSRRAISDAGLDIIDISHLSPAAGQHPGFDPTFSRLDEAWTKLRIFSLSQYERIILIDSDMIFLRQMDELFDLELPGPDWIAAVPACVCNPLNISHYPPDWIPANCGYQKQGRYSSLTEPPLPDPDSSRTHHLLNSGLVVLHPSEEMMSYLEHFLNTSPTVATANFADQDVLAEAFRGRWKPLPWWCNALKTLRAVHTDLWADTEIRLLHYILDKPWTRRPPNSKPAKGSQKGTQASVTSTSQLPAGLLEFVADTPSQVSVTEYDAVHAWWWLVWDEIAQELRRGDPQIWEHVAEWVIE